MDLSQSNKEAYFYILNKKRLGSSWLLLIWFLFEQITRAYAKIYLQIWIVKSIERLSSAYSKF